MTDRFRSLLLQGDLDEVIREVDRLVERSEWDEVVALRRACRAAFEMGHQLWPADAWAAYRLALDAPPQWAGPVSVEDVVFSLGPLSEVAASRLSWVELGPHVPEGARRVWVAQERAVRGEVVDEAFPPDLLEVPLALAAWEPAWPLARYRLDRVEVDEPPAPPPANVVLPRAPEPGGGDPAGAEALTRVVRRWREQSEAGTAAVAVAGGAEDAVAALAGGGRRVGWSELEAADGLALLGWAAASGGRRGRRSGAATGRVEAWWTAAVLTDLADDWPLTPAEAGGAAGELRWCRWSEPGETGWVLRLAVEDPAHGLAWAIDAVDPPDARP